MRWIITGALTAKTPLAIRTGLEEGDWDGGRIHENSDLGVVDRKENSDAEPSPVAGIELDAFFHPYITATALKNLVRRQATRFLDKDDLEAVNTLFGTVPTETQSAVLGQKQGIGGCATFGNAYLQETVDDQAKVKSAKQRPALRGKTAIAEGTRTADDGQLRYDRTVANGTTFEVEVIVTTTDSTQVQRLLSLLACLDGESSDSALGSGTRQGDGRVAWDKERFIVRRFGPEEAAAWVRTGGADWRASATEVHLPALTHSAAKGVFIDIPLSIQIEGYFLVGAMVIDDKARARAKPDETAKPRRRPYQISLDEKEQKTARLPGSSLDGALRAQAMRIFRTISGDFDPWTVQTEVPECIKGLFGDAKQGSMLDVETLLQEGATLVTQDFVAIDRFSGGQFDSKKFDIEAFEAPCLTGKLRLHLERRQHAAFSGTETAQDSHALPLSSVGLLALILKDLATGDITLGFGTRKGYGQIAHVDFGGRDWQGLLHQLGDTLLTHSEVLEGVAEAEFVGDDAEAALMRAVQSLHDEAEKWAVHRGLRALEEAK